MLKKSETKSKNNSKTYHFISGMPRSGSTLLANILMQNPRFHSTATSGIMDIMFNVRNVWNNLVEFQAAPNYTAEIRVLRGILESYFSDVDQPIVFDKGRGWLSEIEMIEAVLGHKVKILVPVRDMRDILASFEKLWRKNAPYSQAPQARDHYFAYQTVDGRVSINLQATQPVGLAYNRIVDAINRGFADRLFLIDFDDLTHNPEETMKQVYKFIDEPYFEHNFQKVEQVTYENDAIHGIQDLHKIRTKVAPVKSDWQTTIGPRFEHLGKLNFWKHAVKKDIKPLE